MYDDVWVEAVMLQYVMSQHDTWHVPDVILRKCSNDASVASSQYSDEAHETFRDSQLLNRGNNHREKWSLTFINRIISIL